MQDLIPVILSGGSGTRLWPLSREAYPKQFLPLVGDDTMLQATWKRVAALSAHGPMIVANHEHRFMVAEQMREAGADPMAIILEPVGRNTAPAIAIAALEAMARGEDAMLLVLPSDHVIADVAAFHAAVEQAAAAADTGRLVTFGIQPSGPETGYGYIKAVAGEGVRAVDRFVEKPDRATAEAYVASGQYYWNSGMFLFRASRYLAELERLQPGMLESCREALQEARRDEDFVRLDPKAFGDCASDSIDNGGRFQVKRITVKPGAQLSLQMHHHRAEHWVVVSGTGKVTRGDETILLAENQSTYIPLGVVHRLENPGKLPLELIEVQSGSYLGEDDIVRFEDKYGRSK